MSTTKTRKLPGPLESGMEDPSMYPRHVSLIALLVGVVLYGAVISALELIVLKDDSTRSEVLAGQDVAAELVLPEIEAQRLEVTEGVSKP